MKAETASPPASEWEAQRAALQRWKQEFNEVRPHEALGMDTPAARYQASPRPYPGELGDPEYPEHFEARRVSSNGTIKMGPIEPVIGLVLHRECVGLEPIDDGFWHVWFGPVFLGRLRELGRKDYHFEKSKPVRRDR
jgi:hypothetical protein